MAASSKDEKKIPPYLRYAFSNPYNYAVIGGFASAALLNGNWWLGLAGAGAEALWLLFAPDSTLLRKLWFDKRHAAALASARIAEFDARCAALPEKVAGRCRALQQKQVEIHRLAEQNPAFTVELLQGELQKLDDLVRAFLDLSVTCAHYQEYLRSVDVNEIEAGLRRYQKIIDSADALSAKDAKPGVPGEPRELAQKNLAVLTQRKAKYGEIWTYLSTAMGQLELIENSFRLLADQIVTMRSPAELGGQLDELLDGVEAVRQTARETDKLLQAIEH